MIKQRKYADCGVACLAMYLNIKYEEALECFPSHNFDKDGLALSAIQAVIERNTGRKMFINNEFHMGSKGILLVPSLNYPNSCHFVYWGGPGVLLDPSANKTYDSSYFPTVISHMLEVDQGNKSYLMVKRREEIEILKNIYVY